MVTRRVICQIFECRNTGSRQRFDSRNIYTYIFISASYKVTGILTNRIGFNFVNVWAILAFAFDINVLFFQVKIQI